MTAFAAIIATLVCWGAGLYLLSSQAVAPNSYLELIAHGIGIYFIGKGFFVGPSLWKQMQATEALRKLVDLRAHEHAEAAERAYDPVVGRSGE